MPDLAAGFDSVQFCLSKGLGAPVGSLLCGRRDFVTEARRVRKMLGGGMRQVGVLAAAGLVALRKGPARLAEDHANAGRLARAVAELPGVELDLATVRTNIVIFRLTPRFFGGECRRPRRAADRRLPRPPQGDGRSGEPRQPRPGAAGDPPGRQPRAGRRAIERIRGAGRGSRPDG